LHARAAKYGAMCEKTRVEVMMDVLTTYAATRGAAKVWHPNAQISVL
jgi:hypothetical protein